jgi:hypothetical protein
LRDRHSKNPEGGVASAQLIEQAKLTASIFWLTKPSFAVGLAGNRRNL